MVRGALGGVVALAQASRRSRLVGTGNLGALVHGAALPEQVIFRPIDRNTSHLYYYENYNVTTMNQPDRYLCFLCDFPRTTAPGTDYPL